jgi:putative ABC transport system permease protein
VSVLERKLGRDLWRLKGQVATIALVLGCGIMAMLMMRATWQSLLGARDSYYAEQRFADVFARLERAPDPTAARLAAIPGVAVVYPRLVKDVMVPIDDEMYPVPGRIVSIPADGEPPLNRLYLRSGRLPEPRAADEAVILEQFANAHGLVPGDRLPVVLAGTLRQIRIVGIALSPEYVLAMSGAEAMPDTARFVVLWMVRDGVAPVFQMEGAFNDVAIRLEPGASVPSVLAAIDHELAPYGGFHAVPRDKQASNAALSVELDVLRSLAVVIPAIFLAVAAFLVNVVVSRLVFLERTQIAVLKALGFSDTRIAFHYLGLVALVVAIGAVLGLALGVWAGSWMTGLYVSFYSFPTSVFEVAPSIIVISVGVGAIAGVAGALISVRRVARMAPAQAMRPPMPLSYRRSLVERIGVRRVIGPSAMMVVREIERRPLRFAMSVLGIAMGVAIFVMGRFSKDSFDHMMSDVFVREHREDITVALRRSRPERAVREVAQLPGVLIAEGQRVVGVRFRSGSRWRDGILVGLPEAPRLRQLLDHGTSVVAPPARGVLITDRLAEQLGVAVGDSVDVEIMEGDFATRAIPIAGTIDEAFGLQAYARADWLAGVMREEPRVSAVLVRAADRRDPELRDRIERLPEVAGVTSTTNLVERYEAQMGSSMLIMTLILALSAAAISIGIVYNNARIALSMRSRELATLRVLGFTRREISSILLGELGAQVLLGVPLGLVIGTYWSRMFASGIQQETMEYPFHISPATYATAAVIAAIAGLASALLVRRKLDQLDLVGVLKSSD